jgi:chromosomal replication initiation ATPase DnaA
VTTPETSSGTSAGTSTETSTEAAAQTPAQLVLDLGHRPALGRTDYLVSQCNADAVAWVDRWPDWPAPGLVIWGPAASGKSHLGQVWRARAGAPMITTDDLDNREPPDLAGGPGVVYVDGADNIAGDAKRERVALHVYNLIAEQGGHILFSARTPPGRWRIALADLRSRLNALPAVTIAPPDDAVLGAVLLKLFTDRQINVGVDVIQFAVTRMERSFEAAERLVTALDAAALASQRRVTIPLLREVLPRVAGQQETQS